MTGIDFFADAVEAKAAPEGDRLETLIALTKRAETLQEEIAKQELYLASLKQKLAMLVERSIPDMMDDLGLPAIPLPSGQEVTIKDQVVGSLPKEDRAKRERALAWLKDTGLGGLIRPMITITFERGQDEPVARWLKALEKFNKEGAGIDYEQNVNSASLAAAVRERLREGLPTPFETLGVHVRRVAVIKNQSTKRRKT